MRSRRILTLILAVGEDVVAEDVDVEAELRQANHTAPRTRSRRM